MTKQHIIQTLNLHITGKVQGVYYRLNAQTQAQELGLKGWVRNLSNGQVEALIQGTDKQLSDFIDWAWKGPEQAEVKDIQIHPSSENPLEDRFNILPTK